MRAASLVFMPLGICPAQVKVNNHHIKPPGSSELVDDAMSGYVKPVLLQGMTALPDEQTDCPTEFTVGRTPSQV